MRAVRCKRDGDDDSEFDSMIAMSLRSWFSPGVPAKSIGKDDLFTSPRPFVAPSFFFNSTLK